MANIAPTAFVDPRAEIGRDVVIEHGCFVAPHVVLGDGCHLLPHVTILGKTQIGARNVFYPTAVIGAAPQDLKYKGTDTRLIIGDENIFREHVTVHVGTENGGGVTTIGSHNQFQVGTHVAHDSHVGSHCVLSNSVQVAGHVHIEDHVNISGLVGIQQFVTVGRYSFIAGATRCTMDVPPFLIFAGFEGGVVSVNDEGMRRWGFDDDQIARIWKLYKLLYPKKADRAGSTIADRIAQAESNGPLDDQQRYLLDFIKRSVTAGVCGRYLESRRRDGSLPPPPFYSR